MTQRSEVLVVGGGPGGLAAATAAATAGLSVNVLDDNASPGGQIWRAGVASLWGSKDALQVQVMKQFQESGAKLYGGRRVIDAPGAQVISAIVEDEHGSRVERFTWDRLILATGARERFLPFPGWTLPGVFGAGGLQALIKGGFVVTGKRVVVAGTGPLLLAVAAHLKEYGAEVVCVVEQAPFGRLAILSARLWKQPAKLMQGLRYGAALMGIPYRAGCWPVEAVGTSTLSGVRLSDGRREWLEECELLACGFHLVPNTELAALLGCALRGEVVSVDDFQRTSVPGVYCVGESGGVAGLEAALTGGRIAGLHSAGREKAAETLRARRRAEIKFGEALDAAFALRPELLKLAAADTVVCRCEDVRYGDLAAYQCWTDAKLQTRCGMGPCQGRICGPATRALFGWRNASVRPPLFPVPLSTLGPAIALNETMNTLETQ